jgi:hypothetical protein
MPNGFIIKGFLIFTGMEIVLLFSIVLVIKKDIKNRERDRGRRERERERERERGREKSAAIDLESSQVNVNKFLIQNNLKLHLDKINTDVIFLIRKLTTQLPSKKLSYFSEKLFEIQNINEKKNT